MLLRVLPGLVVAVLVKNNNEVRNRLRVFENRAMRKVFVSKRDKVIWKRRKLHNEELYDMHSSPHITRLIKSIKMRRAGNIAHKEDRCIQVFGWET
jgi:hypothetical protein